MLKDKKILVAEDDSYVRTFITTLLKNHDCTVFETGNGEEAVSTYYHREEIDCAVIDLKMPDMDGTAFAAYNYENSFFPVVICTGRADSSTALSLLKYGIQDYVLKPFNEEQLITSISHAIERGSIEKGVISDQSGYNWSVGSITIPTLRAEVNKACDWVDKKLDKIIEKKDKQRFVHFLFEFIYNAFEHGNLNVCEDRKSEFLNNETYSSEISRREQDCTKKIAIELSLIRNEVGVKISDEGKGFNYEKYLQMGVGDLVRRMDLPNGRGIYMAKSYFDEIMYENGGRDVTVKKTFGADSVSK